MTTRPRLLHRIAPVCLIAWIASGAATPTAAQPPAIEAESAEAKFSQLVAERDPLVDAYNATEVESEKLAQREALLEYDRQLAELAPEAFPNDAETLAIVASRYLESLDYVTTRIHHLGRLQDAAELYAQNAAYCAERFGADDYRVRAPKMQAAALQRIVGLSDELRQKYVAAQRNLVKTVELIEGEQYDNALALGVETLAALRETVGESHFDIGSALNNLALANERKGDSQRAAALYEQSAKILQAALGAHPRTANTIHNHALMLMNHDDYRAAEPFARQAARMRVDAFGESHPATGESYYALGVIAFETNRFDAAMEMFNKYGQIAHDSYGESSLQVANALFYLGRSLTGSGQPGEAAGPLERCFEIRSEALGESNLDTLVAAYYLGDALERSGQPREASSYYEQALSMARALLAEQHAFTALILNDLGVQYTALKTYDRAESLLTEALDMRKATLGEDHQFTAGTLLNLAKLHRAKGDFDAGVPYATEAIATFEQLFGAESAAAADGRFLLASLHHLASRYDDAADIYRQVIELRTQAGQSDRAIVAQHSLANALYESGDATAGIEQLDAAFHAAARLAPADGVTQEMGAKLARWYAEAGNQAAADAIASELQAAAAGPITLNNLKMLGLALHNYADSHGTFPAAGSETTADAPRLSWRVLILPYLEQQELYEQFHLDEPWDSEHNKSLIAKMPDVFATPGANLTPGLTAYLAVAGGDALFGDGAMRPRFASIADGTSNTIMLLEADAAAAVEWTRPVDWQFDPSAGAKNLGKLRGGEFACVMADGAARMLPANLPRETFNAAITRTGGEFVELP